MIVFGLQLESQFAIFRQLSRADFLLFGLQLNLIAAVRHDALSPRCTHEVVEWLVTLCELAQPSENYSGRRP